jgi:hypothetical protein
MAWTTPRTWTDGELVDDSILNTHIRDNFLAIGPTITRARTTADVSVVASTTLANLTGISFAIGASEIWTVALHGMVSIDATGDYKSNWTVPSGATGHHWVVGASVGASRQDFTTAAVLGVTATTEYGIDEFAAIVNSTTAGTVQFQFAQNSASGTDTWRANAFMIATRLS